MLLEVASQLPSQKRGRTVLIEVVGKEQAGGLLPSKVPQESLLRDSLRDVVKGARFCPGKCAVGLFGMPTVPLELSFREQRAEALLHPGDEARRRFVHRIRRLVWHLAIELIAFTSDWHQVHVHTSSSASLSRNPGGCPSPSYVDRRQFSIWR